MGSGGGAGGRRGLAAWHGLAAWAAARARSLLTGSALACIAVLAGLHAPPAIAAQSTTADHSKFDALKGPFASGAEVTRACLGCHTEAARQVMATRHWTWDYVHPKTGQRLGKRTMLNSFCIGDRSNEPFCQSCHVGYGWKDASFDFQDPSKVDCLVCHHQGGYAKPAGMAGEVPTVRTELPPGSGKFVEPIDLAKVAQGVGSTGVAQCGACHFYGGGGDGVKHGDLDSSLTRADRDLDVHMAPKSRGGAGFGCSTCHEADGHRIAGSRVQVTAVDAHGPALRGADDGRSAATCQSCHGHKPHDESLLAVQRLNNHTDVLACQACHVPAFARGGVPTKMGWDWSTAGKLSPEGKPFQKKDEHGHVVYDSKKGDFALGENVVPDYVWFDGTVSYTLQTDTIDPSDTVRINRFHGTQGDAGSRIWPVKRFSGQQPYDKVHRQLLVPHTAVPDDTAFWFNFDWPKALRAGAEATGKPFSGEYGFVRTEMLWPITHMVAPASQAVRCNECHADQGRLAQVAGVYVPGRDAQPWIDRLGWLAVIATLAGVLLHGALRVARGVLGKGGRHG